MERYDRYKDSGVEWIGEIPEGWVTRRLKNFLDSVPHSIVDGPFGSDLKSDEYTDTGVPVTQLNNIKEGFHRVDSFKFVSESKAAQLSSHFVFPGDLLMAKMMPAGRTCIASSAYPKYLLSSDSIRIVIDSSVDRRFVCYAANCYCLAECELKSSGVTRIRINLSIVRNLSFVLPSLQEQKKIADYLDQKTAEIDSLIEKNEKSIELLEEYRKSIISEAVTKGIDPNAPMKDSGVEWIGEIPEGWHVARFKQVVSLLDVSTSEKPDNVIMLEDIESWTGKLISTSDPNNYKNGGKCFQKNDVLFSKLRPYLAKAVYAPFSGVCSGEMLVLRSSSIDHKFLQYHLLSHNFIDEINAATYGAKMPRASWDIVGETQIAFPGLKKQKQIVSCLNEKTAQIDSLIDKKKQLIEKLTQYRKSLISECVTGKIKVPGVE